MALGSLRANLLYPHDADARAVEGEHAREHEAARGGASPSSAAATPVSSSSRRRGSFRFGFSFSPGGDDAGDAAAAAAAAPPTQGELCDALAAVGLDIARSLGDLGTHPDGKGHTTMRTLAAARSGADGAARGSSYGCRGVSAQICDCARLSTARVEMAARRARRETTLAAVSPPHAES